MPFLRAKVGQDERAKVLGAKHDLATGPLHLDVIQANIAVGLTPDAVGHLGQV